MPNKNLNETEQKLTELLPYDFLFRWIIQYLDASHPNHPISEFMKKAAAEEREQITRDLPGGAEVFKIAYDKALSIIESTTKNK